jgi:inorganic pyrophosphatase
MVEFWARLEGLITSNKVIIDRPKGSSNPRYPECIYPPDYGYIENTSGGDGNEIDVWRGSKLGTKLVGIVCTVDITKGDAEFKLLINCTNSEINKVSQFHNNEHMSAIVIKRRQILL